MFPKWESKPVTMTPAVLEYKYIMVDGKGNTNWESGDNRKVDLQQFAGKSVMIEDDGWNNKNRPAKVYPLGSVGSSSGQSMEYEKPVVEYQAPAVSNDTQYQASVKPSGSGVPYGVGGGNSDQSKKFIKELLDKNASSVTWKAKLEVANNLIYQHKDDENFPTFKTEGLAILSAYLYFINSGQITCGDQGHFRPNHQAGLAYSIYKVLDKDCLHVGELGNSHIIRLLKTQLPSFAD